MQEILKLESDLTHMFDSDERVAMALLEHIRNNKKAMLEKDNGLTPKRNSLQNQHEHKSII